LSFCFTCTHSPSFSPAFPIIVAEEKERKKGSVLWGLLLFSFFQVRLMGTETGRRENGKYKRKKS
jgi:hypothetical protein